MTAVERAERFRTAYTVGIGTTATVCALLALRADRPSRALAVFGAAAGSSILFAAAAWPATKQVAADVAAEKVADSISSLADSIFKKPST